MRITNRTSTQLAIVLLLFAPGVCWSQSQGVGAVSRGVSISFQNASGATDRGVSIGFRDAAGTIQVTTNVPAATFTITGPATYTGTGQSFTKTGAPAGTYTIAYGAVPGFTAPASETLALSAGGTITFSRTYTPLAGIGRIQVTANLDAASYTVSAITNTPGFTPFTKTGKFYDTGLIVPAGTYQITFSAVSGYFTPSTQTLSLGSSGTLQFSGIYRRIIVVLFTGFRDHPGTGGVVYPDTCQSTDCPGVLQLASEIRTDSNLSDGVLARTFTYYDSSDYTNSSEPWKHPPGDSTQHVVAADWLRNTAKPGPDDKIVVVGHSYGGNRARLFAQQLPNYSYSADLLVTLDPINWAICNVEILDVGSCREDSDTYAQTKAASIVDVMAFLQQDSLILRGYYFFNYPYSRLGNYSCGSDVYCSHVMIAADSTVHRSVIDRIALLKTSQGAPIYAITLGNVGTGSATITWKTPTTTSGGSVIYSQNPDASTGSVEVAETTGAGTSHSASLSGLIANTRYYFRIRARIPGSLNSEYSSVNFFLTSQANAPILKASNPTLTRNANGTYLSVTITNTGASAVNGTVTGASIGAYKTTVPLPLPVPDLAPGGSFIPGIPFPSNIGAVGSTVYPIITLKYPGSTFTISVPPVTVP